MQLYLTAPSHQGEELPFREHLTPFEHEPSAFEFIGPAECALGLVRAREKVYRNKPCLQACSHFGDTCIVTQKLFCVKI